MSMTIRRVGDADRAAVWSLLKPVFRAGDTYAIDPEITEADALAYWFGGQVALVAELDGEIVGTAYLRPNAAGGGSHVANAGFVTSSAHRGKGIARRLLDRVLAEATEAGYAAMQFNFVVEANARAVTLWTMSGFSVIGRIPQGFRLPDGTVCDALILHKTL
ncbi:GNAT family N-acetyltransferase [Roseicyclus sp. F158]|uniref:GNAT family N-acetyltransferase n=1 Tax=Tropicimonas omnivorans TaxID=3075590 RepID=A0ABU3DCJ0_9RHOB|nr:GNAT family N-acetyltransferase [Roseicyclus sp. F158]MDT0681427.1 GNAT family N-acetyltransferase [Roseicyclus sp. F158]